ncbi:hypothetical protein CR513_20059, partial [Mucuna pruriens]
MFTMKFPTIGKKIQQNLNSIEELSSLSKPNKHPRHAEKLEPKFRGTLQNTKLISLNPNLNGTEKVPQQRHMRSRNRTRLVASKKKLRSTE